MREVNRVAMKEIIEGFCEIEADVAQVPVESIRKELFSAWRKNDEFAPIAVRFELFFECHPYCIEPVESSYDATKDIAFAVYTGFSYV